MSFPWKPVYVASASKNHFPTPLMLFLRQTVTHRSKLKFFLLCLWSFVFKASASWELTAAQGPFRPRLLWHTCTHMHTIDSPNGLLIRSFLPFLSSSPVLFLLLQYILFDCHHQDCMTSTHFFVSHHPKPASCIQRPACRCTTCVRCFFPSTTLLKEVFFLYKTNPVSSS